MSRRAASRAARLLTVAVLYAGVIVLVVAAPGRAAWAQGVPVVTPEAQARADFDEGVRLARAQRWTDALTAFERSRARVDRPNTALNVALALRQLGRMIAARQVLRECLAMPQTAAEPDLGRDAALLLGLVVDAIATVSLAVDPPDATVRVDGESALDPRAVELDPGEHAFVVSAPRRADETFALTLRAGERTARAVRLRELPGRVEVLVTPSDAQVYVNDALLGRGAVRWEGAAGAVRLRATRVDYGDRARELVVAPGALVTERLTLTLTPRPLHTRPWFWGGIAIAAVVVAGVTTAIVLSTSGSDAADGGSTGTVLDAR
jgi:hypothetical protein